MAGCGLGPEAGAGTAGFWGTAAAASLEAAIAVPLDDDDADARAVAPRTVLAGWPLRVMVAAPDGWLIDAPLEVICCDIPPVVAGVVIQAAPGRTKLVLLVEPEGTAKLCNLVGAVLAAAPLAPELPAGATAPEVPVPAMNVRLAMLVPLSPAAAPALAGVPVVPAAGEDAAGGWMAAEPPDTPLGPGITVLVGAPVDPRSPADVLTDEPRAAVAGSTAAPEL